VRLWVDIPDPVGVLYIEGELVRTFGTERRLESPPVPPGRGWPLHVRAAFKVGDRLLIEDKVVLLYAGEIASVTFDGAVSWPCAGCGWRASCALAGCWR